MQARHRNVLLSASRSLVDDVMATTEPAELYLDLMKKILTRSGFESDYRSLHLRKASAADRLLGPWLRLLRRRGIDIRRRVPVDPAVRAEGRDLPSEAETMVGLRRLDHLQECILDVVQQKVPGDLIETGVWRGEHQFSCVPR
jgi:O-methyltransferase